MKFFFRKKSPASDGSGAPAAAYYPHRHEDVVRFTTLAGEVFLDKAHQIDCFGADWNGRQFTTDQSRLIEGKAQVIRLDPETQEILEMPFDYQEFLRFTKSEAFDEFIKQDKLKEWISKGGQAPEYGKCVCPKVPLFLGGKDTFGELAISDLEVYWSILGQILSQIRDLPIGTPIGKITIS